VSADSTESTGSEPGGEKTRTGTDDGPLLTVLDLHTQFHTRKGIVRAVNGVSFSIETGEMLGIVGESGCGKSVTGLSIMRLVPSPGRMTGGRILFGNRDLRSIDEGEMRLIRGNSIAMIFQDPLTALNPVLTISRQITEALTVHARMSRRDAKDRAVELLRTVEIPSPEKRINDYPHQFSGGMRQRVMIAMAISCKPKIIIADEPTTALDVTIQAQILELMQTICAELGTSIMLITHALGIVAGMCRTVAVMYAGRIVEQGDTRALFSHARHPYTHGLLTSTPRMDRVEKRLTPIGGTAPSLIDAPTRCAFAPRCAYAVERCRQEEPLLAKVSSRQESARQVGHESMPQDVFSLHSAACFRAGEQLW
jgi:oligopeptide transport system ATP-binding protein